MYLTFLFLPCFLTINALNQVIAKQREEYALKPSPLKPSLDVPSFVGTVLLGGFRAIAIDLLWVRATTLQRLGEWWELNTLFELIAHLQPNQEQVWAFNAWNLAYNISVNEMTPKDQWLWVKKGIEFLEQGIEKNGHSYYLPWYLAVIYSHKISQNSYFERACPERFQKAIASAEKSMELLPNPREFFQSIMALKNCYSLQAHEYERLEQFQMAIQFWKKVIETCYRMEKINPHFLINPAEIEYLQNWIKSLEYEEKGDLTLAIDVLKSALYDMLDTHLEIANKLFSLQDQQIFELQKQGKFDEAEAKIQNALVFWKEHHLRAIEFDFGVGFPRLEDFVTLLNQTSLVNQLWKSNHLEMAKKILCATLERIDGEMQYNAPKSMEQRFQHFGGKTSLGNYIIRKIE
ncbi:MAG: hypothetical protein AABZ60_12955 [Planctomycetota bacterium]